MKKHSIQKFGNLLVFAGLCFLFATITFAQTSNSPTLTKLSVTFYTTTNDKDKDTKVDVRIIVNDHNIGKLSGFEIAWPNNFDPNYWWDLDIVEHSTKEVLNTGTFHVTATAHGNDLWQFTAGLRAEFSDGSKREWTFEKGDLNSQKSQPVSQDWPLAESKKP